MHYQMLLQNRGNRKCQLKMAYFQQLHFTAEIILYGREQLPLIQMRKFSQQH